MLCACSGEKYKFEDSQRSSESLATRDFSVSSRTTPRDLSAISGGGVSSRATPKDFSASSRASPRDLLASGFFSRISDSRNNNNNNHHHHHNKIEDDQVDEVESTLKEALSLNYEEARALLGRIEYQKCNFTAALQLFQGIDISRLTPRMTIAISERARPKKQRSKSGDNAFAAAGLMSTPSVTLLLEAIFLKAKTLEELGRLKDAAKECLTVIDIIDAALPNGMEEGVDQDSKMQEMLHKSLELLPKLWQQAGHLDEAIASYRRALIKPWNLGPCRLAAVQKDLASTLLYSGVETGLPAEVKIYGSNTPESNLEEAILLLFLLMNKVVNGEIQWDPEIMDHLTFALSICGGFEYLAYHVEQVLPGVYTRVERWYLLALTYSAAGQSEVSLNLVKKAVGSSESKHVPHFLSLLFGAKLCSEDLKNAREGIKLSRKAIELSANRHEHKHFSKQALTFLGVCYSNAARVSVSSFEREIYRKESSNILNRAVSISKEEDPELVFKLGLENAVQRNLDVALENALIYSNIVGESSMKGWKLLALVLSAQKRFKDAETVVDLASKEVGARDHLELLRLKAVLQIAQDQPKQAIESYGALLALIRVSKEPKTEDHISKVGAVKILEVKAWQDLCKIYTDLGSWRDAEFCVDKVKSIEFYNPGSWHSAGVLFMARSLLKEALAAFSISLSIDPEHVPSMVSSAKVFMELGSPSLPIARNLFMNALKLEPTNHEAWFNLGLVSKQEGLLSQAVDCFQAACELRSSAPVQPFFEGS